MTGDPLTSVPSEARVYQGEPAGLVTRGIANIIDAGVVLAVLAVAWLGLNVFLFLLRPRSFSVTGSSLLTSLVAGAAVAVLYLGAAWAATARSYGCHVMGLRVVDRRHRRLGLAAAVLRAFCCVVFPIGLLWCAAGRARFSLQDIVLRTVVIYDWVPRRPGGREGA